MFSAQCPHCLRIPLAITRQYLPATEGIHEGHAGTACLCPSCGAILSIQMGALPSLEEIIAAIAPGFRDNEQADTLNGQ